MEARESCAVWFSVKTCVALGAAWVAGRWSTCRCTTACHHIDKTDCRMIGGPEAQRIAVNAVGDTYRGGTDSLSRLTADANPNLGLSTGMGTSL